MKREMISRDSIKKDTSAAPLDAVLACLPGEGKEEEYEGESEAAHAAAAAQHSAQEPQLEYTEPLYLS
jgi:hypothetical protein